MRTVLGWLVIIWLLIGAFAGFQRGYFTGNDANCAKIQTMGLTIAAGPLNYAGVNPRTDECAKPPKPSR